MPDNAQLGPYIEFRDVSKAFGDNVVLQNVTFDVMVAETVCILGRSGVGKSVSLHHIMGFLKPDSGRVFVAGQDITTTRKSNSSSSGRKSPWFFRMERSLTLSQSVRMSLSRCVKHAS
jgi:ABC-type spermidine/putrescine transport systems, ATPase components